MPRISIRTSFGTARILVNHFSDRIAEVGSLGLPDIFEEGRTTVDLALSKTLSRLTLRLSADNLGNTPVRFLQGPETHRRFTLGRTVALQIAFSAF